MKYEDLLELAREASKNAYAPYSNFPVGACVLTANGKTFKGCNVENASFGLTICAERAAIASAISNGEKEITAIAIYSPKMPNCLPCGACRQVIYEFQGKNPLEIVTEFENGIRISKINDLFPQGFKL